MCFPKQTCRLNTFKPASKALSYRYNRARETLDSIHCVPNKHVNCVPNKRVNGNRTCKNATKSILIFFLLHCRCVIIFKIFQSFVIMFFLLNTQPLDDTKIYSEGNIFSDIKLFVFSQWFQTTSHIDRRRRGETSSNGEISQTNFFNTILGVLITKIYVIGLFKGAFSLDFILKSRFRQMVVDFKPQLLAALNCLEK